MKVQIETSSLNLYSSRCQSIEEYLRAWPDIECQVCEDNVGYGISPDDLVLGIIFIARAIGEGASYDIAKFLVKSVRDRLWGLHDVLRKLPPKTQVSIYIENETTRQRIKVIKFNEDETIEITLPDGVCISVK